MTEAKLSEIAALATEQLVSGCLTTLVSLLASAACQVVTPEIASGMSGVEPDVAVEVCRSLIQETPPTSPRQERTKASRKRRQLKLSACALIGNSVVVSVGRFCDIATVGRIQVLRSSWRLSGLPP